MDPLMMFGLLAILLGVLGVGVLFAGRKKRQQ